MRCEKYILLDANQRHQLQHTWFVYGTHTLKQYRIIWLLSKWNRLLVLLFCRLSSECFVSVCWCEWMCAFAFYHPLECPRNGCVVPHRRPHRRRYHFNCHIDKIETNSWFGTVILFKSSHLFAQSAHHGCGIKLTATGMSTKGFFFMLWFCYRWSPLVILPFYSYHFQCHIQCVSTNTRQYTPYSHCCRLMYETQCGGWHYIAIHREKKADKENQYQYCSFLFLFACRKSE